MKKLFLFLTLVFLLNTATSNAQISKTEFYHCLKVANGESQWGHFTSSIEIYSDRVVVIMGGTPLTFYKTAKLRNYGETVSGNKYVLETLTSSGEDVWMQTFDDPKYGVRIILKNGDSYQFTVN